VGHRERPPAHVASELTVLIDGRAYAWRELLLPTPDDHGEWSHPGLAVVSDGRALVFRQGGRRLLTLESAGTAAAATRELPVRIGHGITVDEASGAIWIADPGLHAVAIDGAIVRETNPGRVVRIDVAGAVTAALETPPLPVYRREPYRPTSVALVADQLWVADGYGQSLVHRFDANGAYVDSIDGTAMDGSRFDCPHALFLDPRSTEPLVWVADRGNAQLRAYDADGNPVRATDPGVVTSPSGMTALGDLLVVAELSGWIAVLDPDGDRIATLGNSGRSRQEVGWPNDEHDGRTSRPQIRAEAFNSPHAVAARPDGSLLVAEWLLGGRLVELRPLPL
jgi:hypothetical protein